MWCVTWRQDGVNVTKVLLNTRETVFKVHTNDLLRTICIKRQTKKMILMKWKYSYSVQRQITQIVISVVSIILLFSILFLLLRFMIGSNNSSCMGDWIWGQVHKPKTRFFFYSLSSWFIPYQMSRELHKCMSSAFVYKVRSQKDRMHKQ